MHLALAATLLLISSAHAATDPQSCGQIPVDMQRLACYDAAFGPPAHSGAAIAAPPAATPTTPTTPTTSSTTTAPPPSVTPEAIFGKVDSADSKLLTRALGVEDIESIETTIAELRTAPSGRYVLALANGQTWAQTDDTVLPLRPGDVVRIRHGAMGSYLLGHGTAKKTMRVKRVD